MKTLVTGAGGQLGCHLCRLPEVVGLTRGELDITRVAEVQRALEVHQPELVVNAAAYTAVDRAESEREAAFAVNAGGVEVLARACEAAGIPLMHFSTDYVFDGNSSRPYREDDPPAPLNVYGASKLAGEERLRQHLAAHVILRISWIFSARGSNFVKTILSLARKRDRLRVVDDQHGCPTWAGHVARVVSQLRDRLAAGTLAWGTYHYCDAPAVSWCGFAREIVERAGLPVEVVAIPTADYPTPALRPRFTVLDCRKLGAQYSWQEGLAQVLAELHKGDPS